MTNATFTNTTLQNQFILIREQVGQPEVVELIADIITQTLPTGPKTISIIGGAASGKSTIAEDVIGCLRDKDIASDMICTDNYVIGDREYRQTVLKEADAQKKYDFELMDEHIRKIKRLQGQESVSVPVIDTETGIAADAPESEFSHDVKPVQVLVIEGDFPRDDYDLRFYIQVPDAQRLQNNIDRETEHNDNADPGQLTEQFNTRQRTHHKPYTLPALQSADYVMAADTSQEDWTYSVYQRKG